MMNVIFSTMDLCEKADEILKDVSQRCGQRGRQEQYLHNLQTEFMPINFIVRKHL